MHRDDASVVVHAPAKLNLFLEILARRADGYHEIETLMTAVDLFDTVCLRTCDGGELKLRCRWALGLVAGAGSDVESTLGELPTPTENLAYKALELLRLRAGIEAGAEVSIVKRIPAAAGLGGASSDAAATLMAANQLWGINWPRGRLAQIAAELGSDVPFFLGGGAALCRGRGEQITPVKAGGRPFFVIVKPPQGLSTAEVYAACQPADRPADASAALAALRRGDAVNIARAMFNRLQPAAESLSPWMGAVRDAFEQVDCLGRQMSGSGSSYFGVCRNLRHARRVEGTLRSRGIGRVFCTRAAAMHTAA